MGNMINALQLSNPKIWETFSMYFDKAFLVIHLFYLFEMQATFEFQVLDFRHAPKRTIKITPPGIQAEYRNHIN